MHSDGIPRAIFESEGIWTRLQTLLLAPFRENGEYGLRSHARGMCRVRTAFGNSPALSETDQLVAKGAALSMVCDY